MAILPRSSCDQRGSQCEISGLSFYWPRWRRLHSVWQGAALADDLQTVGDPDSLGFSARRLARMTSWFEAQSEKGDPSGFVVGIARGGKLAYLQAHRL